MWNKIGNCSALTAAFLLFPPHFPSIPTAAAEFPLPIGGIRTGNHYPGFWEYWVRGRKSCHGFLRWGFGDVFCIFPIFHTFLWSPVRTGGALQRHREWQIRNGKSGVGTKGEALGSWGISFLMNPKFWEPDPLNPGAPRGWNGDIQDSRNPNTGISYGWGWNRDQHPDPGFWGSFGCSNRDHSVIPRISPPNPRTAPGMRTPNPFQCFSYPSAPGLKRFPGFYFTAIPTLGWAFPWLFSCSFFFFFFLNPTS